MSSLSAHNVHVHGAADGPPMLFAHGFGCDQDMWRLVAPAFAADHRVVLFDYLGFGGSDRSLFDPEKYATLDGYAADVVAICEELDLQGVTLVGHSVSGMIGVLAARRAPERIGRLVLVCPSPRFIDDPASGYVGGFSAADIDELLDTVAGNYLGWSSAMAPVIMGDPAQPELADELEQTFCEADPDVALTFAKATFLSDHRDDLPHVAAPCLVLQTGQDAIAPAVVGEYVQANLPAAELVTLDAVGHCPNLSAPEATVAAIRAWL